MLSADIDNIIRIKGGAEWNDSVGKSYDAWLNDLRYLAEQVDKFVAETEKVVSDIRAIPFDEVEGGYKKLSALFAEVGF